QTNHVPPDGGAPGQLVASGRPMRECQLPTPSTSPDVIASMITSMNPDHHTFAYVPSSASGRLSGLDADRWALVDLDPTVTGYNTLPLGVLPEQIASSDDGCRVVTANRGSCDLTFIDPSALLTSTLGAACPPENPSCTTN